MFLQQFTSGWCDCNRTLRHVLSDQRQHEIRNFSHKLDYLSFEDQSCGCVGAIKLHFLGEFCSLQWIALWPPACDVEIAERNLNGSDKRRNVFMLSAVIDIPNLPCIILNMEPIVQSEPLCCYG